MGLFPRISPELIEELQSQNDVLYCERDALEAKIAEFEREEAKRIEHTAHVNNLISRYHANVNVFEDVLKTAVVSGSIEHDLAQDFSSIFGFDLLQEVDVEVTVTFLGTAKLPLGTDAEDFDWNNQLNFSCDSSWSEVDFELDDISHPIVEVV